MKQNKSKVFIQLNVHTFMKGYPIQNGFIYKSIRSYPLCDTVERKAAHPLWHAVQTYTKMQQPNMQNQMTQNSRKGRMTIMGTIRQIGS